MTSPAPDRPPARVPRSLVVAGVAALVFGMVLRTGTDAFLDDTDPRPVSLTELLRPERVIPRTANVYHGLGVWIDAFDFEPAYQSNGGTPTVTADVIDDFHDLGVDTIYLQAARRDSRSPDVLLDEALLTEFLARAHARDMAVVGWYLPKFDDVDADLARLAAIADFRSLGHRFDGVAVDIEFIEGVADDDERSLRLVELSIRLRAMYPDDALGAIVPPPVQLEVVNPSYWPRFPWAELEPLYDVWLPMAYWTTRTIDSGYRDAFTYTDESSRRLRNNVGRDDIVIHQIGGIGTDTRANDLDRFALAVAETEAVGASIYDWASLPAALREKLREIVPAG